MKLKSVKENVWGRISDKVWCLVKDQVEDESRDMVRVDVEGVCSRLVWRQIEDHIRSQIWRVW